MMNGKDHILETYFLGIASYNGLIVFAYYLRKAGHT